jgi:hypothetical protein
MTAERGGTFCIWQEKKQRLLPIDRGAGFNLESILPSRQRVERPLFQAALPLDRIRELLRKYNRAAR